MGGREQEGAGHHRGFRICGLSFTVEGRICGGDGGRESAFPAVYNQLLLFGSDFDSCADLDRSDNNKLPMTLNCK